MGPSGHKASRSSQRGAERKPTLKEGFWSCVQRGPATHPEWSQAGCNAVIYPAGSAQAWHMDVLDKCRRDSEVKNSASGSIHFNKRS